MRTRSRPDHAEVVQRRLEQLRAELASRWAEPDPGAVEDPALGDACSTGDPGVSTELAWPAPAEHHAGQTPSPPAEATPEGSWWRPHTRVPGGPEESTGQAEEPPPAAALDVPVPGRHAARRARGPVLGDRVRGRLGGGSGGRLRDRAALTPWHLTLVSIGVAAALAAACWWVIRSDPKPAPVAPVASARPLASLSAAPGPARTPGATPGTTPQALATPSGSAGTVTVDVEGRVRRPGIAVLAVGSRVVDAIKAAGGASHRRDLAGINLAAVLTDGQQIVVGPASGGATPTGASPTGSDAAPASPGTLVDLNTAGLDELDTLPGVGPVTAQSILDWREENGGFTSVDELMEVDGIGPVTLAKLTPLVTV